MFFSNPYYQGPKTDHFNGTRFFYPTSDRPPNFFDVIKWKFTSKPLKWPPHVWQDLKITNTFKQRSFDLCVTYIGHSSFLVQINHQNILVDPIYAKYAGPVKANTLKRRIAPGIAFDDLPPIDIIILSHNHYDHCDVSFLRKISKKDHPKFVVPLGLDQQLKKNRVHGTMYALDWHESVFFENLQITLTPAKHWSARGIFDKNMTLWGGYVISHEKQSLFFMGDSGFDQDLFQDIGHRYGPFDISLISIGAYHPRWFMKYAHMNPHEACLSHLALKSNLSLAMHHRSFPLADEGPLDPEKDLQKAKTALSIPLNQFIVIQEGSSIYARKI